MNETDISHFFLRRSADTAAPENKYLGLGQWIDLWKCSLLWLHARKVPGTDWDNQPLDIQCWWAEALLFRSEVSFSMFKEQFLWCTFIIGRFIGIYLMQNQLKTNQFTYFYNKWLLFDFPTNLFISKLVLKVKIFNKLLKFVLQANYCEFIQRSVQKQTIPEILNNQCIFRNTE